MAITDTSDGTEDIPENLLETFALSPTDWRKAQKDDPTLRCIIHSLQTGTRVSASRTQTEPTLDCRYLKEWDRYFLSRDGVLYRKTIINEQEFQQLVILIDFGDVVFRALHDDLGHQGRDRKSPSSSNVSFGQALIPT